MAIDRIGEMPPFKIQGPYTVGLGGGPGQPSPDPVEGDDFRELVYEILCRGYDYELQQPPVWPVEPGRRLPIMTKGQ